MSGYSYSAKSDTNLSLDNKASNVDQKDSQSSGQSSDEPSPTQPVTGEPVKEETNGRQFITLSKTLILFSTIFRNDLCFEKLKYF